MKALCRGLLSGNIDCKEFGGEGQSGLGGEQISAWMQGVA